VIYSPFHVASFNQKQIFDDISVRRHDLKISFFSLDESGMLKPDDIKTLRQNSSVPIVITVYPNLLDKFKDQLLQEKILNPIVGGSSWDNSASIKRLFLNFKNEIFHSSGFDRSSLVLPNYRKLRWGIALEQVTAEEIFGFDLGQVIGELWMMSSKDKSLDFYGVFNRGFCVR